LLFMIILSIFIAGLAACQDEKGLFIEHPSVEFGSKQDPYDRNLHFQLWINDHGMDPQEEYNIRFFVEDSYIRELIGADVVEVPDTYETLTLPNEGSQGLFTGTSVELKKKFDPEKLRKAVEKKNAVTVEVYSGDEVFDRQIVTTFLENITPAAEFSSKAKIDTIELTDSDEITVIKKALSEMTHDVYKVTVYYVKPDYQLNLGGESYYLWANGDGKIMNVKDPYILYSLPTQSLNEVLQVIDNINE